MFYIHVHRYLNKLNKLCFIDKCKPKHRTAHFVYNVSGMWLILPTFNCCSMSHITVHIELLHQPPTLALSLSQELTNPTARMILINARQLSKLSNISLCYSKKYPESWQCPRADHLSYSPVTYLWLVPTTLGLTHSIPGVLTSLMFLTHPRHASTSSICTDCSLCLESFSPDSHGADSLTSFKSLFKSYLLNENSSG